MEEIGELIARYYVVKTDGIFSKNPRFLHVHQNVLEFHSLNYSKPSKSRDFCFFKDLSEATLSTHNDKDVLVKAGKQSFTLYCTDRVNLLIDILFAKDLWDLKNSQVNSAKIPLFKGFRQVDPADPSTKTPITVQLLRAGILVELDPGVEGKGPARKKRHWIRYNEVDCVIPSPSGIFILTKTECEKYVLESETMATFVDYLKDLPKKHLGISLAVKAEQACVDEKFGDVDEFAVMTEGHKFGCPEKIPVRLHVTCNTLLEVNPKDGRILSKCLLTSLGSILINRAPECYTLKLFPQHGGPYKCRLKPHEADYLLANILHAIQTKDDTDFYVPPVLIEPADLAVKIHAIPTDIDPAFENSLKKEVEEAAGQGDILDNRVRDLIFDAALNASFKTLGFDHKFVALLFALLVDLTQILLKLENDPSAVASYKAFLASESFANAHNMEKVPVEKTDPGRLLFEVSRRIPPLLGVIKNCLFWRGTLPEISAFQKQIDALLVLAGCQNSTVSIAASLTLRSLLKLNKSNEKRLETHSKKWVIRELDVITKLGESIKPHVEGSVKAFLDKIRKPDEIHVEPYLQLYGMMSVFEIIFLEKREAHPEDVTYIVNSILDQESVLNLIEQLSMYHSRPIIYQATLVSAQSLLLLYNTGDKEQLAKRQHRILMYTTILLWNIRLLLSYNSVRQQRLSASVAALLVTGNPECSSLINRMFPKSLLKKVDAGKSFVEWKPESWKDLFVLLQNTYRTATEQWNDECRTEIKEKLKETALEYFEIKHTAGKDSSKVRWNYEEYEVRYKCLEEKCKVGKYYLKDLLKRNEGLFLYFTETIMKPVQFWNKLVNKFLAITNVAEQQLVLTVLNLVYQDHFQMIRDMKILPYFVHLLENESAKHLHTLILELIYTSLKIKYPEVVTLNYQMILHANGLENLVNLLSRTYHPAKDNPKSEKIRRGGLIIRIFDLMLKKMDKKNVYPVSQVRAFCETPVHLAAIVQTLLSSAPELRKKTIKFIGNYFVSQAVNLKPTGVVDFLITALDSQTGAEAFGLLYKIEAVSEEYNADLDFDIFTVSDHQLINTNDRIKNSVFLRYFPVPFVKYLTEDSNREQVLKIYLEDSVVEPALIWGKEMRELLQATLAGHLGEFKSRLNGFVENKAVGFRTVKNMPTYPQTFKDVLKYPQIEREIRCAEYYLRVWNQNKGKMENVHQVIFFNNLEGTFGEVVAKFPELNLDDFEIVLKSYTLAYLNFNKKGTFPCFGMFLKVLEKVCEEIKVAGNQWHLKSMLKFVYRTIRIGMNFNAFEEYKGTAQTISVIISWLRNIEEKSYVETTTTTLSGIRWGLAVINEAVEKSSTLWGSIEYAARETLFKKLFELVYHLQKKVFKTEYPVLPKKDEPKVRHQLSHLLRIPKYKKTADVEGYGKQSVFELMKASGDAYAFSSVFHTMEMVHCLLTNLSQSTDCQRELLSTGCYTLALLHFTIRDTLNYPSLKPVFALDYLEAFSFITFRHLAAFTTQIKTGLPEPLSSFGTVIPRLTCEYILRLILQKTEVVAHRIKEPPARAVAELLAQVLEKLDKDVEHPECLWNESTRVEFSAAVIGQVEACHSGDHKGIGENFAGVLKGLEYSAYKTEIILGGVFIRLLNKDPYMHFTHPTHTMKEIIQELAKVDPEALGKDQSTTGLERTVALFEAVNNIIVYQKGLDLNVLTSGDVRTLCRYVDPWNDSIPKHKEAIYNHVLAVLLELTKDPKQTINVVSTPEFVLLVLTTSIHLKNEYVVKRLMACLENIVGQHDCDPTIIHSGLLVVWLRNAIDRGCEKRYRVPFISFVRTVLSRNGIDHPGISPVQMMVPRQLLEKIVEDQQKKSEEWVDYLDVERREITFIWNQDLYNKVTGGLQTEVSKIEAKLKDSSAGPAKWEGPVESYIATQFNKGEIVITDIVLSVFLQHPATKIKKPYGKFLDSLCDNILLNSNLLSVYRSSHLHSAAPEKVPENIGEGEEEKKAEKTASREALQETLVAHQNGLLCMLTALLYSYEQIYKNPFNVNKVPPEQMSRKRKENGCTAFVTEVAREIILSGMQSSSSVEILITILEIVYLLTEQKEILEREDLLVVTNAIIQCMVGIISTGDDTEKTFEVLAFVTLLRILDRIPITKGKDPILDAILGNNNLLDKLKLMHAFKPHLKQYTEQFIWKLCQYPFYFKILSAELKYELGPDVKIEKIIKTKYEPLDKVWRKSPTKLEDCKMYDSSTVLEGFDITSVNAGGALPIVSNKIFGQEKFEAAFHYMYEKYGSEWNKSKILIPL